MHRIENALERIENELGFVQSKLAGKGISGRLNRLERDVKAVLRNAYLDLPSDLQPQALLASRFSLGSQNEEDGITWSLLEAGAEATRRFVDIGCGDNGGNCGFLAAELGWSGLMLDGDAPKVARARLRFGSVRVSCRAAFITRENVDALLRDSGMSGEIDVLSIDIDGNDYWIWDAITEVDARLIIVEYNSLFGDERSVVVPYDPEFDRRADRLERKGGTMYYGASLAALDSLAARRGYRLVAVEPRGLNAFFVRNDVCPGVLAVPVSDAYRRLNKHADRGHDVWAHIAEHDLPLDEV